MLLLEIPNELLFQIAENLDSESLNCLLRTSRFSAKLLTPLLHKLAMQDKYDTPALLWAAERGHRQLVALLLEKGADINIQNRRDWITGTALHKVAMHQDISMVRLLLDKGANIEAVDQHKKTPLHHAVIEGFEEMVRLLLGKGANVKVQDYRGSTPLQIAIAKGANPIIVLLLDSGAEMEARNEAGMTALHQAVSYGSISTVRLLLDRGANMYARGNRGETPMILAHRKHYKKVRELLSAYLGQ